MLAGQARRASALLKTVYAFQVVQDLPYVDADSFGHHDPMQVPALTWLSELT